MNTMIGSCVCIEGGGVAVVGVIGCVCWVVVEHKVDDNMMKT